MRHFIASIIFVAALLFAYLIGAFIAADFNFANWDDVGRTMAGLFGPIFAAFVTSLFYAVRLP